MKTYILTFKLKKHKEAKGFQTVVTTPDDADIQGIKEERSMYFENLYNTPVKCVKIDEISSPPQQEEANERKKKRQIKVGSNID